MATSRKNMDWRDPSDIRKRASLMDNAQLITVGSRGAIIRTMSIQAGRGGAGRFRGGGRVVSFKDKSTKRNGKVPGALFDPALPKRSQEGAGR